MSETGDFSLTVDVGDGRPWTPPALVDYLRDWRRLACARQRALLNAASGKRARLAPYQRARATRRRRSGGGARARAGPGDDDPAGSAARDVEVVGSLLATTPEALADSFADLLADLIHEGHLFVGHPSDESEVS